MSQPLQIRMGGYGPPTTTFSRALKMIGDDLETEFGDELNIKYVWNILDFGYRSEDTLWMAEHGILTLAYQSTSYLSDRVPELGFTDLPFLFRDNEHARSAMDGALGDYLKERIEDSVGYRVLGFFENGFRHVSNSLRPVRSPADLVDMRTRVLPSKIHARAFELLGAKPLPIDLVDALEGIVAGTIDAQENPLANTVAYGVSKYHRFHTLTGHFYVSRGIFANRAAFEALPESVQAAFRRAVEKATLYQRDLAVREEEIARRAIIDSGGEIIELTPAERAAFVDAVQPLREEAHSLFAEELFKRLAEA